MLSKVHSGAVYGVDAYPVEIEVNFHRRQGASAVANEAMADKMVGRPVGEDQSLHVS